MRRVFVLRIAIQSGYTNDIAGIFLSTGSFNLHDAPVKTGRRKALLMLSALAASTVRIARAATGQSVVRACAVLPRSGRRITELIGSNGWPASEEDVCFWRAMGISWGRDAVGPGPQNALMSYVPVDKTSPASDVSLAPILLRNNRSQIRSLLLLGFTPPWNATVPGDSKSAPLDVRVWERYVEAAVRTYSAPPYNIKHFQIWNEAAGRLSGGSVQATFWHGPGFNEDNARAKLYERAMQDYVEKIHIPAARIIRKYHAYVVYGGWPDQGGLEAFNQWMDYRSPTQNARMVDLVDYIDTHYLGVSDLDSLYKRYVEHGPARGLWQTEIGDRYIIDPHYLPRYYFDFAVWALARNWDDPDKYVTMIYHWDGYEPFRLTHRGPPARTLNPSGLSLVVLRQTVPGVLAPCNLPIGFSEGMTGGALMSGASLVLQVVAPPGWRTISVSDQASAYGGAVKVAMIDAMSGSAAERTAVETSHETGKLSIRVKIPDAVNGSDKSRGMHLAYVVVSRAG